MLSALIKYDHAIRLSLISVFQRVYRPLVRGLVALHAFYHDWCFPSSSDHGKARTNNCRSANVLVTVPVPFA